MKLYFKFLIILLIIFLSSCVSMKKTSKRSLPFMYKTGKHISYPEDKYITAYSFDKSEKAADLAARKELINKISSTINAKSTSIKKAFLENSELIGNSMKIKQVIEVESNFSHNELIEIVNRYYDGNNKHYAFAVLNRDKYASILETEMAVANKRFKKKYEIATEMLGKLNIKEFKKIKKELIKDAFNYDTILINYSTVLNDPKIYEKYNVTQNINDLNKLYKEKLNQSWYIYSIYNKISKKDFINATKKAPKDNSWILRDNDENRKNYIENKELTRVVYETIRNEKFNTFELSEFDYNSKKMIKRSDLDKIIKKINNSGKDKVVISLSLLYKCSYDKAFYYCRTGVDVKAYNLENKDELFYFSVEGQTSTRTKAVDINLNEAMKKSIKKLSPIIKKRMINYMKDYKDIE